MMMMVSILCKTIQLKKQSIKISSTIFLHEYKWNNFTEIPNKNCYLKIYEKQSNLFKKTNFYHLDEIKEETCLNFGDFQTLNLQNF